MHRQISSSVDGGPFGGSSVRRPVSEDTHRRLRNFLVNPHFSLILVLSLSCFVGLGNTSERDKQPVISCPEDRRYVCVKMYGGGMGDQIKRYCEKMEPEEYEDILDNEARVAEGEVFDSDPNCFITKDRGREVKVCRCSTDKCNTGKQSMASTPWKVIIMGVLVSLATIILI